LLHHLWRDVDRGLIAVRFPYGEKGLEPGVEGGDPWLIWFDGAELTLYAGDLVTYKGQETERWRETCQSRQQATGISALRCQRRAACQPEVRQAVATRDNPQAVD